MNPSLTQNIAKLQEVKRNPNFIVESTEDDEALVGALVQRIAKFKLDRRRDKHDDRNSWFECRDQDTLVANLQPSADQIQFLGSVTLKLRVMTSLEEGSKARSIDLFCVDMPDSDYSSGHLFSAIALSPDDTQDGSNQLYVPGVLGVVLPGSPEFQDIETIIDSFSI